MPVDIPVEITKLRGEAAEKLTDAFFTIHRQLHPNFDPRASFLPQKLERVVECIISAAILEVMDVLSGGAKQSADTTTKDPCGGSCSYHKS